MKRVIEKSLRLKATALLADIEDRSLLSESMTPQEIAEYLIEESHTIIYSLLKEDLEK